jgi:hypothetical protein
MKITGTNDAVPPEKYSSLLNLSMIKKQIQKIAPKICKINCRKISQ